jgi:hypothetical protein
MRKLLFVCVIVGAVFAGQERSAIAGKWEGQMHDLKAVAITVSEDRGRMEGSVVFYVIRDDDSQGPRVVGQDERKILDPHWDGRALQFAVGAPDFDPGAPGVRFTITVTGDKKAELKRWGEDQMTLAMTRLE